MEKGDKDKAIECLDVVLEHNKIFTKYLPMVKELKSVLLGDRQIADIEDENIRASVSAYLSAPLDTLWNFVEEINNKYNINKNDYEVSSDIQKVKNILVSKYIENAPKQENLTDFFKKILS